MMTTEFRLKVFSSVARNLSYTKASQELYISQPAITKHIHELETQYSVRLFERMGNKISLTSAGRVMLEHTEKILSAYARLDFEMNRLHGEQRGLLRIGASTTIAHYILPPILARFLEKYPDVKVVLSSDNSSVVEQALLHHDIDMGLIEGDVRQPELRYQEFMEDELVAVTSVSSRYAAMEETSPEDLCKCPLVLRENGSGTLSVFKRAIETYGLRLSDLNILMQMGSSESIKLFLENTDCVTILSFRCVMREVAAGQLRIIELPQLSMKRSFCHVQLQGEGEGLSSLFIRFMLRELPQN